MVDNQSAIKVIKNPIASARSKHIDILYTLTRERVVRQEIHVHYVSTQAMLADVLTKALNVSKLELCREGMGVK
jgi:hypothetical protein